MLWDKALGAELYTVEGVTEQGLVVYCTTNDTYCALYNMKCGQMYNISVTANNHVCQGVSTSTETVAITTGEKDVVEIDVGKSVLFDPVIDNDKAIRI